MKRPRGRPPHADVLTPSEWRTVHAVQHGMSNAEIARRRGVSVDAVKFHVANALAKLGLRNRRELRAWFRAPAAGALSRQKQEPTVNTMPTEITPMNISPLKITEIGQVPARSATPRLRRSGIARCSA
jgi:DNA-binding CsgD family transcriptional regulator